mgnify:CR=1 FL=1
MPVYDDIYRNIEKKEVRGDDIYVSWKCPVAEKIVAESSARMTAKKGLESDLKGELTRGAIQQAKYWFASLASSLFGSSAGNTVRRMGTTVADHVQKSHKYGEEEQKEAILKAWEKVEDRFEYSQDCMVYVEKKADAPPPLPKDD